MAEDAAKHNIVALIPFICYQQLKGIFACIFIQTKQADGNLPRLKFVKQLL
jgi:hypothetical protein